MSPCVPPCGRITMQPSKTPDPAAEAAVSTKKATVVETETEENSASLAETENEVPQQEVSQEERPEPETESMEMPADSEL